MHLNCINKCGHFAFLLLLLGTWTSSARIVTPDQFIKLVQDHMKQKQSSPRDPCEPHEDMSSSPPQQECGLLWGSTLYKGRCEQLLKQGPCQDGFWMVLHRQTNRAHCAVQECPEGSVFIQGSCEELGLRMNELHCNKTQQLIINEYGDPECECPMGRIWHAPTAACYTPHLRPPCDKGFTLQVLDDGRRASGVCMENLCANPGEVPMTPQCEVVVPTYVPRPDFRCYTTSTTDTTHEVNAGSSCEEVVVRAYISVAVDAWLGSGHCNSLASISDRLSGGGHHHRAHLSTTPVRVVTHGPHAARPAGQVVYRVGSVDGTHHGRRHRVHSQEPFLTRTCPTKGRFSSSV
ncbi:protein of unknown function DUF4789 [Trinorchestia longiramus]|nr:protein of unknown function DUF4789 [Trinorchestia longiramus]